MVQINKCAIIYGVVYNDDMLRLLVKKLRGVPVPTITRKKGGASMKKYGRLLMGMIFIAVIMLSISGCNKEIELTEEDSGTTISIDVGETFKVELYAPNSSPPDGWQNETIGETVFQVGDVVYTQSPSFPGQGGVGGWVTFTFQGLKAGETLLQLVHPEKTFEATIVVYEPGNACDP
jgi:hypothetical protein